MAYLKITESGMEGNIAKYFSADVQHALRERTGCKPGSTLMFLAGSFKQCNDVMMRLRTKLGDE